MQVKTEESPSTQRRLKAGVPQGAVPLLNNIYTADIPRIPYTHLTLYVDDTGIATTS